MHSVTGASCPKVEHACIVGLQFMYEIEMLMGQAALCRSVLDCH